MELPDTKADFTQFIVSFSLFSVILIIIMIILLYHLITYIDCNRFHL